MFDMWVWVFSDRVDQCEDTKGIRNDDVANQKKHIQRTITKTDMMESGPAVQPLDFLVKKTIPVKKCYRQRQKTNCTKNS